MGVSIGWDYAQYATKVSEILESDVMALEGGKDGSGSGVSAPPDERTCSARGKWFQRMDKLILTQVLGIDLDEKIQTPAASAASAASAAAAPADAESISKSVVASSVALVVFKTESGRDAAVNSKKEITFRESKLHVKALVAEPMGICWENMAIPHSKKRERIWAAIKMIFMASFAWSVLIYMPFAQYQSSFSYSQGDKPSLAMTLSLTVVVVIGNLVMYTTCAEAAGKVGFMLRDSQEGIYMVGSPGQFQKCTFRFG